MNPDEIKTYAIKAVIAGMTWLAARYLPASDQASLAAFAPTIAAGIVAIGAFIYGAYRSTNMKLVPENSTAINLPAAAEITKGPVGSSLNLTPLQGFAKIVGALLIGFLVLQTFPAFAASTKPAATSATKAKITVTQAQANPIAVLQSFTVADLQAALADAQAQTPPDTVSASCYTALIPLVQSGVGNPLPTGLGAFQLLQKARDAQALIANLQSPTGPLAALNTACAPLILSTESTLAALGVISGAVAATGGLSLPIALPALVP
jgi:hypothetical protein